MVLTTWPTTSPPLRATSVAPTRQLAGLARVLARSASPSRSAPPSSWRSLPACWPAPRCAATGPGCPGRSARWCPHTVCAPPATSPTSARRFSVMSDSACSNWPVSSCRRRCDLDRQVAVGHPPRNGNRFADRPGNGGSDPPGKEKPQQHTRSTDAKEKIAPRFGGCRSRCCVLPGFAGVMLHKRADRPDIRIDSR